MEPRAGPIVLGGDTQVKQAAGSCSFTHKPLDHTRASIRLLRILPELSEFGLIQAELIHATVDAPYTCLSYVWGPARPHRLILMNGRVFRVRQNLWCFLSATRKNLQRPLSKLYWIDALCIDQDNTLERNHQVAQMGTIYSQAQSMLIWLGTNESTTRVLEVALKACELLDQCDSLPQFLDAATRDPVIHNLQVARDLTSLLSHTYWSRAWITQEVLLSRNIQVLSDKALVDSKQLRPLCYLEHVLTSNFADVSLVTDSRAIATGRNSTKYLEELFLPKGREERHTIQLLLEFPSRACEIARDRIHSLGFLATDGASIPVDYAMPDQDFFYSVLKALKRTVNCLCLVAVIANALRYSTKAGEPGHRSCPAFKLTTTLSKPEAKERMSKQRSRSLSFRRFARPKRDAPALVPCCSDCGGKIADKDLHIVCLSKYCSLMQGHLIGIDLQSSCESRPTTLNLELDGKPISITSRAVQVQPVDTDIVSIVLHADELFYLIQRASERNLTGHDPYVCSKLHYPGNEVPLELVE